MDSPMDAFLHILVKLLTALFAIGVAGCLITIPIVAWKFFSVLLEKDETEQNAEVPVERES
jgi:hypothetical protein